MFVISSLGYINFAFLAVNGKQLAQLMFGWHIIVSHSVVIVIIIIITMSYPRVICSRGIQKLLNVLLSDAHVNETNCLFAASVAMATAASG